MMVHPAYGMHPAVFASETDVLAQTVEVTIDRATLLPQGLVEKTEDGRVASQITFDPQWLNLRGRKVPGKIRCELPAQGYNLTYEFTVEQGVWLLRRFTRECPSAYSLCTKASLQRRQIGPIPDDWFPSPADLDIPPHSATECAAGERMVTVRTQDGLSLEGKLSLW